MGRAKGKRGKSARRAKAGMLGTLKPSTKSFSGAHGKREAKRAYNAAEKRDVKALKEAAAGTAQSVEVMKEPHSFVIYRGEVGRYVHRLVNDVRAIMDPNTAKDLKVRKSNNLRDFVVNGAPLGVTHMMVFTRGEKSVNLRMMRTPQGPTLTFRVKDYALKRHVLSKVKKQVWCDQLFLTPPLVVMNGFGNATEKHLQVAQTMIQNMFPSINIDTLQLKTVRRCLMVNYDADTDSMEMRHYAIKNVPAGLSKSTKKLVQSKLPDLSKYKDIADFFENPGQLSESEWEEDQKEVELSQKIATRGLQKGDKSSVRLMELGPRLNLELVKVEEGIDEGEVLYHKFINKSAEEIADLKKNAPRIKKMQERRRRDGEHRVIRRLTAVEERQKKDEEERKAIIEKAARRQAAVTGQTEDVDAEVDRKKDREIQLDREREEGTLQMGRKRGTGGGDGQNTKEEPEKERPKRKREGEEKGGKGKGSKKNKFTAVQDDDE